MNHVHMGEALERAIRKQTLSISEVANKIGISRRSLYNWFKKEELDPHTLYLLSKVVNDIRTVSYCVPSTGDDTGSDRQDVRNDQYWKAKYIDLLEKYRTIIKYNNIQQDKDLEQNKIAL
jgi:transcriptional regulator with XRE-family HTH domain